MFGWQPSDSGSIPDKSIMENEEKKVHEGYYTAENNSHLLRYKFYKDRYLGEVKGKKILEIGCGDGGVLQFLKKDNEVQAVDISKNAMTLLKKKGIPGVLADISTEKLPFTDASFDIVIILEVLEHLKSPQYAIEEIQRVLKREGRCIISIPNPRTGHQLLYPCLFKQRNFREYLRNNRFEVLSEGTYGICPPFWRMMKSSLDKKYKEKNEQVKEGKESVNLFSKIAASFSTGPLSIVKPKIWGWCFIYECRNNTPTGAKDLYREIAEDTKGTY